MPRRSSRWKSLQLLRLEDRLTPALAVGLSTDNLLLFFDTVTPGTIERVTPITGLQAGENLLGIDARPADRQLYGVGSTNQLYTINLATGAATAVGAAGQFALSGTDFGVDFNPAVDRLRVVSDLDQNFRVNPNDGSLAGTDLALTYAAGDANAGADPNVVGSAYSNSAPGVTTTTLYGIDSNLDVLVTQNPPNNGTLTTVGALGVDTSGLVGFDISTAVAGGTNTAYASLTVGGTAQLYSINLATGAATLVGAIGAGVAVRDVAVLPVGELVYAISGGTTLVHYYTNAPDVPLGATPITGLIPEESIIGLDFRPANGLLYGLGNSDRLYRIETATAAATQVGTDGAFTLNGFSFGFDFNPVPDRVRVVSDLDQNLRLNPNDGTLTSTDTPLAYAAGDVNAGADPNVVGAAYTNNFAGATTTTLYGIDSNLDVLVTINPPNSGTLNTVGPLGVNTSGVVGFDIDSEGDAYAVLQVGGASRLYSIDLATGAATLVAPIGLSGPFITSLAIAPVGQFQFSSPTYSVGEAGVSATITINRINGSAGSASVDLTAADGTATSPFDYQGGTQTVLFLDGETARTITITINDDTQPESDETVNLSLSNPTDGTTLAATQTTAVLTIVDNDPPGQFQFSSPTYTVNENGVFATITVNRVNGSSGFATVDVTAADGTATSPADYTAGTQTAQFGDGQTSAQVTIQVVDDTLFEPDETVNLSLSNPTGGTLAATQTTAVLTIVSDDPFTPGLFRLSSPTYSVNESGAFATITIERINGSSGAASVDFTASPGTAGSPGDFTAGTQTVQFLDGQTSAQVTVPITDDSVPEPDETFNVALSNAVGAGLAEGQTTAVVTIVDDDAVPVVTTLYAASAGVGLPSEVVVYRADGSTALRFHPYGGFNLGVSVAVGDVTGDGVPDVVTGAGYGGAPHVKVFDGALLLQGQVVEVRSFYAYDVSFTGGVSVAVGDVTGDGRGDIVTGAGLGGAPHVKVFDGDGVTGEVRSFYAYAPDFLCGVRVAAGDVTADDDGRADIVTAAAPGGAAHVKVFSAAGPMVREFYAFAPEFAVGAFVAVGRMSGAAVLDIVVGIGYGGLPTGDPSAIKIYTPAGTVFKQFPGYAYVPPGGVRVAAADVTGDGHEEVIAAPGEGGGPHLIVLDVSDPLPPGVSLVRQTYAFDANFMGGVFVGGATGSAGTGPQ